MKGRIFRRVMGVILSCALLGSMSGCSLPFGQKEKEEEESAGIEASVSKVKIEVGDEEEIEIENYDDLKNLDFEVEDEDIATVEEDDDGVYIVTGISEGKTTVTFTAKDCEDLTIKITVEGGMEPQPVADAVFELSSYDMTVDYDDYDAYLYIDNWADIKDMAADTIVITSSDPDMLYASTYPGEDGGIWLSVYDEGLVTITIEADGFEPAYCTVECTHEGGSSYGGGAMPDFNELDINDSGTINLWSYNMGEIVATVQEPVGYTLDTENGGFSESDNIYYVYFDSDNVADEWITVFSEMPYDEWDFILNGNEPEDFTIDSVREIGEYYGDSVYALAEYNQEFSYIILYYQYYNTGYGSWDYVGIGFPEDLVLGYDDDDLYGLFCEIMGY